jgi:hypothetical protein
MFRHDAESFVWLFLWVYGCSDGSEEVLMASYKVWRKLDTLACRDEKEDFLSDMSKRTWHYSRGFFWSSRRFEVN